MSEIPILDGTPSRCHRGHVEIVQMGPVDAATMKRVRTDLVWCTECGALWLRQRNSWLDCCVVGARDMAETILREIRVDPELVMRLCALAIESSDGSDQRAMKALACASVVAASGFCTSDADLDGATADLIQEAARYRRENRDALRARFRGARPAQT